MIITKATKHLTFTNFLDKLFLYLLKKLKVIERKQLKQMIDALMPVVGVKMPIQVKPEQGVIRM